MQLIDATPEPRTRKSIAAGLRELGVEPGMLVMAHASLRSFGWVCGGAEAVVHALFDAVGPGGTLMFPTHTPANSEPSGWENPPVPAEWHPVIRAEMPGFDPARTPSEHMGRVVECFRTWPGTQRSAHPHVSFAANGPLAAELIEPHALDFAMGERSPLARLCELGGRILLLGVAHDRSTVLHYAESRAGIRPRKRCGAAMLQGGERVWAEYDDLDYDSAPFLALGADFEAQYGQAVSCDYIGSAKCRLMPAALLVAFAEEWFRAHLPQAEDMYA